MSRVAAALVALVILGGCAPAATSEASDSQAAASSGAASASVSASASSSDPASETPAPSSTEGAAGPFELTIWRVIVTELVVRSEPTVAGTSTILPARLTDIDRVLVVDGPETADGYEWLQVLPLRDGARERQLGWVAMAHRDGTPWLAAEDLTCPDPSTEATAFLELAPEERLACYGGETISFTASSLGCGVADGPVQWEPRWLMSEAGCAAVPREGPDVVGMPLRFPPGITDSSGPSLSGTIISGHHDDPASATCVATSSDPEVVAPSGAEAIALCRTQFVVESVVIP